MDRRILLATALLVLPPATHAAGDAPLDRATLKGLTGIGAVIDTIDPELEKLGVTRDALLTAMLARLGSDRLTVDPGAAEFVGLRINAVRNGRGPFAVSLTLGLYQPVLLSRDRDMRTSTETWEVETILIADQKIVAAACTESAGFLLDRFATAYRSVNPEQ
jgi:hypothetical protein